MDELKRLWSLIRQVQGALGGRTVRSGSTTITFTASNLSDVPTVTHDLGGTPSEVIVSTNSRVIHAASVSGSIDATSFQVAGYHLTLATPTTTCTVYWVAFG